MEADWKEENIQGQVCVNCHRQQHQNLAHPEQVRLFNSWVLGSAAHVLAVLKVKSNMDSGMFYGIQKGAIAALESGGEWFTRLDAIYRARRNLMFQLVDKLNCTYDPNAAGMFIWAKLPKGAKSAEVFIDEVLYQKNIFIAPGTIFGSNGEGYIRFSLCVPEEKIKEAIERF